MNCKGSARIGSRRLRGGHFAQFCIICSSWVWDLTPDLEHLGLVCGVWWIPSEVVSEIAGRWKIKNHPRSGSHHQSGSHTSTSSRCRFPWSGHGESLTNLHGPLDGGCAPGAKTFENQQNTKVPNPTVLPLETLSLCFDS